MNEPIVIPTCRHLGDCDAPCHYSRRCYINAGHECPICLEPILRRREARLLTCGHGFHEKCISAAYVEKMQQKWNSVFRCPMCRIGTHLVYTDIGLRYNPASDEFNGLDQLENFWDMLHATVPEMCPIDGYVHTLGMQDGCMQCSYWRQNGTL